MLQTFDEFSLSPTIHYRRALPGCDFSLEANTGSVPQPDRFFVFKAGDILLDTRNFNEALARYQSLCRDYWEGHLETSNHEKRMECAWGLLSLDPSHKLASEVINDEGTVADQKRLSNLRRSRWAARRAAAFRKRRSSA